jgi:hypothetical protein
MLQREIDMAIQAGWSFEEINSKIIAPCILSAHTRCALWVYAHSRIPSTSTLAPRRALT